MTVDVKDLGLRDTKEETIRARVSRAEYDKIKRYQADNGLRMSDFLRLAAARLMAERD